MAVTLITHNIKNGMVYRQYLATSDSEIEKMVENAQKAIKDWSKESISSKQKINLINL